MSSSDYLNIIFVFGPVSLLMALTPGPDFTVVTQQTLHYGKKGGLQTTSGMMTGLFFHACLSGLLVNVLNSKFTWFIPYLQAFGFFYLFILGVQSLISSSNKLEKESSKYQSFISGLIINLLNPKIIIFYLSVVPQFLKAEQLTFLNILFICSVHILASGLSMTSLSLFLDQIHQRSFGEKFKIQMEQLCGITMISFSFFLLNKLL